ncbi:amino acid ABC transporter permease [Paenibacillus filicis]|uniref:Amino acid ABC transporter permease n=1 Tax=Paenibacillus filicis TaxID=669464 RepID=A0ABU9DG06_9BACL
MQFDMTYVWKIIPDLLRYVPITLLMAVLAMVLAVVLGLVLALVIKSKIPVLVQLSGVYISFFRGTPVLVQLFIIYFGLPQLYDGFNAISAFNAVILGLSLNTSAYLAEVFRAALDSVDRGQLEAGYSVGMSYPAALRRIILPQAVVNALPATGNIFIGMIKNTSLAFTLGVTELLAEGKMLSSSSLKFFEVYFVVGLIYWALTIVYSRLQAWLEHKLSKPYQR